MLRIPIEDIVNAVNSFGGNRRKAAEHLDINYDTLTRKIAGRSDVLPAKKGRPSKLASVKQINAVKRLVSGFSDTSTKPLKSKPVENVYEIEQVKHSVSERFRQIKESFNGLDLNCDAFNSLQIESKERYLWYDYWLNNGAVIKNDIAEFYYSWCKNFALGYVKKLPQMVDHDCLVQAAHMAMTSVIDKYNGSVKFTTYACMRVNGAMRDELRNMDIVPRLTRIRERKRLKLIEDGKNPEEHMTSEEYDDSFTTKFGSIDKVVYDNPSREVTVLDSLACDPVETPLERDASFRYLCRGCTLEEEIILYLYYVKDHNMKYIGQALHISESRVSQMHKQILERLKQFDLTA